MPELNDVVEQPVTPETTPESTATPEPQPAPDIDKMSVEELEKFVASKPGDVPAPEATPAEQKSGIEIEVDEATKLKFENNDELIKSFVNAQKLIKKFNGERAQAGVIKSQHEQAQAQIQQLTQQIQSLQQGAQQMQAGQQPNRQTSNALSALSRQGNNPVDPISALYGEISNLKRELDTRNAEVQEVVSTYRQSQQAAQENSIAQQIYSDVGKFIAKHPEYKTGLDFEKIDDIVSTYGDEAAATQVSATDLERYRAVMGVLSLKLQSNHQDLEEAYVVQQHRNGTLGSALANAHKSGIQSYDKVLSRAAQSATNLPNTLSTPSQAPTMGEAEISAIMAMDPSVISSNPELTARFNAAVQALGINV